MHSYFLGLNSKAEESKCHCVTELRKL